MSVDKRDRLEDAIYASPLGTTTPWRCKECGTAIAHLGQPCKCTPELLEPEKNKALQPDPPSPPPKRAAKKKRGAKRKP